MSDFNLMSDDDFNSMLDEATTQSTSSVFRPGEYTLAIKSIVANGPARKDSTWTKVKVVLSGTGEFTSRETYYNFMFPTQRLKYDNGSAEGTAFPFLTLQRFLAAVGIELTTSNANEVLGAYIGKDGSKLAGLVGKTLAAVIGHKATAVYAEGVKSNDGTKQVQLRKGDEVLKDDTGTVMLFKGDDAYKDAQAYAEKIGENYSSFPEILSISPLVEESAAGSDSWQ